TVCAQTCPLSQCTPWLPNQTDPGCPGVDLTAGVPCTGHVPICNVGNTTAPAGVTVYVFPGNSQQFPKCNPDLSGVTATCKVPTSIGPGACVDIVEANCTSKNGSPSLSGNLTIMVNPPVAGAITECHCENNWSDYHQGSCIATNQTVYQPTLYRQQYVAS